MNNLGIFLQARTGSARMSRKLISLFFQEQSILDLLIEKVEGLASEKLYYEQVTNFVCGNPKVSDVQPIPADLLVF
jgi:hypothetical protein